MSEELVNEAAKAGNIQMAMVCECDWPFAQMPSAQISRQRKSATACCASWLIW